MAEEVKAGAESQVISEEQLRKAEEYVQQEEGAANRLAGWVGVTVTGIAVVMTLFHLYAAYDIVPTQELRYIHVAFVLLLSFLLFPLASRFRNHVQWFDIIPALAGIAIIIYALAGGDDFLDRAAVPDRWDVILGGIFIVLVLEAARRTTGPIMPIVAILFIAYAMFGPYLPPPWTHRGFDIARLVGHLFITLEGIFGVAVDVSATLIIMFTIYGAVLQHSGAGKGQLACRQVRDFEGEVDQAAEPAFDLGRARRRQLDQMIGLAGEDRMIFADLFQDMRHSRRRDCAGRRGAQHCAGEDQPTQEGSQGGQGEPTDLASRSCAAAILPRDGHERRRHAGARGVAKGVAQKLVRAAEHHDAVAQRFVLGERFLQPVAHRGVELAVHVSDEQSVVDVKRSHPSRTSA